MRFGEERWIASLRIHVECAIGPVKNFPIMTGTLPLSMAQLANQIVCAGSWLTNFQPARLPTIPDSDQSDKEMEKYFKCVTVTVIQYRRQ